MSARLAMLTLNALVLQAACRQPEVGGGGALLDRCGKQAAFERAEHQQIQVLSTGRLPGNSDSRRIVTKLSDVILPPLQCSDLIEQGVIPSGFIVAIAQLDKF